MRTLRELIAQHKRSEGNVLLDVACGTGNHIAHLHQHFRVTGLDLSEEMLAVARRKRPAIPFIRARMEDFNLGQQFDVVTCLFSAIGCVKREDPLRRAIATMTQHVAPGGVLLVEPWFTPDTYLGGTVHANFVNEPELKIARMVVSRRAGDLSIMDMHHLVATTAGVRHFVERHEMALFTREQYEGAFRAAGLEVIFDEQGLMNRGLFIGRRPEHASQD